MDANELYITLVAVQGELHNTLVELFGMLCIEHKEAASTNTKQAFSNILKTCKYLENVKTLNHGFTKNKVYDTHEDGTFVLRDEIHLKILDSLFLFDVLKNVKGFPTFQKNLQRRRRLVSCKQTLHQQCCIACNHKCLTCDRKECKDDSCHEGEKCNQHPCRNCDEKKETCLISSSVCCKKCGSCFYCGYKLKLDPNERCDRLRLVQGMSVLKNFRMLLEDLTFQDCKLLLDGSKTLPRFPLCRSLYELCDAILEAFKEVLQYLSKPENFKKQHALSHKIIEWKIGHIASIFRHKDTETLLYTQQDDIHKVLAFINESRIEPSKEYTNIFNKIEELNNDEKFIKSKVVNKVLVLDGVKETIEDEEDMETAVDGINETTLEQVSNSDSSSSSSSEEEEEEEENVIDENNNQSKQVMSINQTQLEEVQLHERDNAFHELSEVVNEIWSCVQELKQHSETINNNLEEKLNTISNEQVLSKASQSEVNKQLLGQLTEIMEKVVSIETETKIANEERKREIEEIKRNQKNLIDLLQPNKQKALKKQGIFKNK